MTDYLKTIYFKDEYGEKDYPQLLCDHIAEKYLLPSGTLKGKKILDIGSGKGNHLVGFSRWGMNVFGLDKRDECINILDDFNIRYCDIEKDPFPFEGNMFDFIFSKSVLEHVVNTDNFLSETLRILKPGGIALLMTPDWKSQHNFFWDDYTHVKAFTRKSLQNALNINGYDKVECSYFMQLPIVWKHPWFIVICFILSLLPDSLKWKDKEESHHRKLIRFSKEKMLLAFGVKPVV